MKNRIEQIVKNLATENFDLYKEEWVKGKYDELGVDALDELANEFINARTDFEIERDKENAITESDYTRWVREAWDSWYYDFIKEHAYIEEDGVDGNGLSVEDILAKGSKQKIAEYLGLY